MGKLNIILIALVVLLFASCTSNRYATTGPYESDEVYYTADETYISDFALVDDIGSDVPQSNGSTNDSNTENTDDYYSTQSENENVTNNYYGNVYQSPWMNSPGYWNSGFGCYNYGSYWNNWGPTIQLGWNPWSGWYTGFSYNWGWGGGWNGPNWNNGWWNSPFYDPWGWNNGWCGYNAWGWNPYWNSPYNFYSPGFNNGWAWNNNGWFNDVNENGFVFGRRNPIAVSSSVNSTYTDNVFYDGTKEEPGFTGLMNNGQVFDPVTPAVGQTTAASPGNFSVKPENGQEFNGVKPQVNPSISNGIISVNENPEVTNATSSPFKPLVNSKPSTAGNIKPSPTYTLDRPSVTESKPSSKPENSRPGSNGISKEPVREKRAAQPEKIRMNEPVRSKEPFQQQPQREQRKPSMTQPQVTSPQRERQPERINKPEVRQPQRREQEISKPKQQESKPAPSINRSSPPSRSTPSSPSSPSRSGGGGGGGGGSTPRRK